VVLEPHGQSTLDTCPLPEQCDAETDPWLAVTAQERPGVVESSS